MASFNEFAFAVILLSLSAFALSSKVWQWRCAGCQDKWIAPVRIISIFLVIAGWCLAVGVINVYRSGRPWSQAPKAWDDILVFSTIKLEKMHMTFPVPPVPHQANPSIPSPKSMTPTYLKVLGITSYRAQRANEKSYVKIRFASQPSLPMDVRLWEGVPSINYPSDEGKLDGIVDSTWASLLTYTKTKVEMETIPDNSVMQIESHPATWQDINDFASAAKVPVAMQIMKNLHGDVVFSFCGIILGDGTVEYCARHNGPAISKRR